MTERFALVLYGVAMMAILWAGMSYASPQQRCISENGTVWASEPVNKCYKLTDFAPASAFTPAKAR